MPGSVQSIERAAATLRLLARAPGDLALVDVAQALGLAKSTAHGIVRTLQGVGFVEQDRDSGRYRLGRALGELGSSPLDLHELRSRATNWADALASRSGESVRVCAAVDSEVVVVHHVFRPDDSRQRLEVGTARPAHACAMGKLLLAHGVVRLRRGQALEPLTARTAVDRAELREELSAVRRQHWALDREEVAHGQAGLAAPVRSHGGLVVAAVGITGPVERVCDPAGRPRRPLLRQVQDCARAVSRELVEG